MQSTKLVHRLTSTRKRKRNPMTPDQLLDSIVDRDVQQDRNERMVGKSECQKVTITRRKQSKEELEHLHNSLRNWHAKNKEYKYGDPEAIRAAVMRGSDRPNRKCWGNKHIHQWYELPLKVRKIPRSKVVGNKLIG